MAHYLRVGDLITTTTTTEASYSGYAGLPVCVFEPGMIGRVAVVDLAPPVRGGKTWISVEFERPGVEMRWAHTPADLDCKTWRVFLDVRHVRPAPEMHGPPVPLNWANVRPDLACEVAS